MFVPSPFCYSVAICPEYLCRSLCLGAYIYDVHIIWGFFYHPPLSVRIMYPVYPQIWCISLYPSPFSADVLHGSPKRCCIYSWAKAEELDGSCFGIFAKLLSQLLLNSVSHIEFIFGMFYTFALFTNRFLENLAKQRWRRPDEVSKELCFSWLLHGHAFVHRGFKKTSSLKTQNNLNTLSPHFIIIHNHFIIIIEIYDIIIWVEVRHRREWASELQSHSPPLLVQRLQSIVRATLMILPRSMTTMMTMKGTNATNEWRGERRKKQVEAAIIIEILLNSQRTFFTFTFTGPIGYSDTVQSNNPATVTCVLSRKGPCSTENHRIEWQSLTVTLFRFRSTVTL